MVWYPMNPLMRFPFTNCCIGSRPATGFSLVEAVISIGVVSFAMLGLLGVVPAGLATFQSASNTSAEAAIVRSISEEILRTDYDRLAATNWFFDNRGVRVEEQAGQFSVAQATPVPLASAPAASAVVIRVWRCDRPGATNSYSVIVPRPSDSL
jgi:Tfp pilus assembly protein PilV